MTPREKMLWLAFDSIFFLKNLFFGDEVFTYFACHYLKNN